VVGSTHWRFSGTRSLEHHVDAEEFARKLDVLLDWDEVEEESTYA